MRLVALLSWYDEDPGWLYDTVTSLAVVGADALVAVDGAYALFPDAHASSSPEQREAIAAAAAVAGIDATIHTPSAVWAGNETEKRTLLFRLGEAVTGPDDWYLVIDGDEVIQTAPVDLKQQLAACGHDNAIASLLTKSAGEVMWSGVPDAGDAQADMPLVLAGRFVHPLHCMFRAIRGLHVGHAHFEYLTPDGRELWGREPETPFTVPGLVIEHRLDRPERRRDAAMTYYETRDRLGIERRPVDLQPAPQSVI